MSNRAEVTMLHTVRRSLQFEKSQLSKEKALLLKRQSDINADSQKYDGTFSANQVKELTQIEQRLKEIDARDLAIDDQAKDLGEQIKGLGDVPGANFASIEDALGEPTVSSAPGSPGVHYID